MRGMKLKFLMGLFIIGLLGGLTAAPAAIITNVVRGGSSQNLPPQVAPNPLTEDALAFVDRVHQYNGIPARLVGAEYVMVANSDKNVSDYRLDVTLSQDARVYLFLDNRLGHGNIPGGGDSPLRPDLVAAGMTWVTDLGFIDTGRDIGIDENGDGSINRWSSVYVKEVPAGTITLFQQNDPTGPGSRNMYGVAALKWGWFPHFWFLNARVRLVRTPEWVTIPTGYWGGWYWWHHQCCWLSPWQGPLQWYWPHCYEYPYWIYWDYWPYYRYNLPWWHYWQWRGWPYFWGFKDCLTFRYWSWKPTIVYWWSYYWDPNNQGNCLELVTMSDEQNPAGPRIMPLDPDVINHLEVQSHQFSVNGGKAEGEFSPLEYIPVSHLEHHFSSLPGVAEGDVCAFMNSDIVKELIKSNPSGTGLVGVQHAQWQHPKPSLTVGLRLSDGLVYEWDLALEADDKSWMFIDHDLVNILGDLEFDKSFTLRLFEGISLNPGLHHIEFRTREGGGGEWSVLSWDPKSLEIVGADPCGVLKITPPQTITIRVPDNDIRQGNKCVMLACFRNSDPTDGVALKITIVDDECGGLGYHPADINRDCKVDFRDFAAMADGWLACTDPNQELSLGLVAHYKLDGNAKDSAGTNHGTEYGSPTYVGGVSGQAISLDGIDDYIDCGNNSVFNITDKITLAAWANITPISPFWADIVTKGNSAWRLSTETNTRAFHFAVTGPPYWWCVHGTTEVPTGEWHHVCGTYDGTYIRLYVDGAEDPRSPVPYTGGISTNGYNVYIGENAETPGDLWNGLIDDVRIYNRALNENEIKFLCTSGP